MDHGISGLADKIDRIMEATHRIDERCKAMHEAIQAGKDHQRICDDKHEKNQIRWAKAAGIAIGSGAFSGTAAAWIASILEK